jgi:hypothetical protein
VAFPALMVPVPSVVAPSLKVTVPVIVPAMLELTVAVNVTDVPTVDGFSDDATDVVVAAGATPPVTTWLIGAEFDGKKSPLAP